MNRNAHSTNDPATDTTRRPPAFPAYHFGRPVGLYHRRYGAHPSRHERPGSGPSRAGAERPPVAR
jgi:hypothetical protein